MSMDGPSIIAQKLQVYFVQLNCKFCVVSAFSAQEALNMTVDEAGPGYDPSEPSHVGLVELKNRPQVYAALDLID